MATAKTPKDPLTPKARPKVPVRLHGICPDGHEIDTEAPAGRTTLSLVCPAEGCTHQVVARRVPGQGPRAREGQPATDKQPAAGIRKARWTRDEPPHFDEEPDPDDDGGSGDRDDGGDTTEVPADHPAPSQGTGSTDRGAVPDDLEPPTARRRPFGRRRRVQSSGAGPHRLYPGIY